MNTVEELVREVANALVDVVDAEQIKQVKGILYIKLHRYNLEEKTTELVEYDSSNNNMLKLFLAAKSIEGKSEKTLENYKETIRMMLEQVGKKIGEISTNDLRCYLFYYKNTRNVSDTTIDNIRRVLSSFFNWLAEEDYIIKSPTIRLKRIKVEKKVKNVISDEELELIRMNCKNKRDRAIIELLYSTGIRVSELTRLDIKDVDFINKEIVVHGKGNKQRKVYMNGKAKIRLQKYLESREDDNEALFVTMAKNKLTKQYERLGKQAVEARLREIGRESNVKGVFPHAFRTKFATDSLKHGMPIEKISAILGHSQLETTKIYALINDTDTKAAYLQYVG